MPDSEMTREEIVAILRANRTLGPEYDETTAQQILDRFQAHHRIDGGADKEISYGRGHRRRRGNRDVGIVVLSIPLLAIAGGDAGVVGVLAVLGFAALAIRWSRGQVRSEARETPNNGF